jgi:hypothetical protein
MTIVRASEVPRADLWRLGNNVVPRMDRDRVKRAPHPPASSRAPSSKSLSS